MGGGWGGREKDRLPKLILCHVSKMVQSKRHIPKKIAKIGKSFDGSGGNFFPGSLIFVEEV